MKRLTKLFLIIVAIISLSACSKPKLHIKVKDCTAIEENHYYKEEQPNIEFLNLKDVVSVTKGYKWKAFYNNEEKIEIEDKVLNLNVGINEIFIQAYDDNKKVGPTTYIDIYRLSMYKVNFNTDGGSEIESIDIIENSLIQNIEEPVWEGHTFTGWDYDFSKPVTSNLYINALWDINEYNINLNVNGGKLEGDSILKIKYEENVELPTPNREGYTFKGWYKGDSLIENNFIYKYTENISLKAKWEAKEFTITYLSNGGTLDKTTQTVTYDSKYSLFDIVRKGYTFVNYTNNGKEVPLNGTWKTAENVTITANWNANKYQIHYLFGVEEIDVQDVYYDNNKIIMSQLSEEYYVDVWKSNIGDIKAGEEIKYEIDHDLYLRPKSYIYNGDDFIFEGDTITGYIGNDSTVIIPHKIIKDGQEHIITKIDGLIFNQTTNVNNVIVSDGIESIKGLFVYWCQNLNRLELPKSMKVLDTSFYSTNSLKSIYYHGTSDDWCYLTQFPEPNSNSSPTSGDAYLYLLDENLQWSVLKTLVLPRDLTNVINYQFFRLQIETIYIPKEIKSIGRSAFVSYVLENVYFEGTLEEYLFERDFYYSIFNNPLGNKVNIYLLDENGKYYDTSSVTSVELPSNITEIKEYQFMNFTGLESITIPEGVTTIGIGAFLNCTNLKTINLPSSLVTIDYNVFQECKSLESLIIPNGVKSIGTDAFRDAVINNLYLPNTIEILGYSCFLWSDIENVYFEGTLEEWNNIVFESNYSNPISCGATVYVLDDNNNYVKVNSN